MLQLAIYIFIGVAAAALLVYLFIRAGKKEAEASPQYRWQKAVQEYGDPAMINLYQNAKSNEERAEIASFVNEALDKREKTQAASPTEQAEPLTDEEAYTRELEPKADPGPAEKTMEIKDMLAAPAYQFWQEPALKENNADPAERAAQDRSERDEQPDSAICPVCGEPLEDGYDFCIYCGKKINPVEPEPSDDPVAPVKKPSFLRLRRKERQAAEDEPLPRPEPLSTDIAAALCAFCGEQMEPGDTFCIYCGSAATGFKEPASHTGLNPRADADGTISGAGAEETTEDEDDFETPAIIEPVYGRRHIGRDIFADLPDEDLAAENNAWQPHKRGPAAAEPEQTQEPQYAAHDYAPPAEQEQPDAGTQAKTEQARPDFSEPGFDEPIAAAKPEQMQEPQYIAHDYTPPAEQEQPDAGAQAKAEQAHPDFSEPDFDEPATASEPEQMREPQYAAHDYAPPAEQEQADAGAQAKAEQATAQDAPAANPFMRPMEPTKEATAKPPVSLQEILENMRALEEKIFAEVAAAEQETQNIPLDPRVKPVKKNL
ncbi:MAG: zinc-ribbon domain-containing protein [Clostridia bacterium]|nr:zinc-ribbon domain-containing protein [Clostridia bacterium]